MADKHEGTRGLNILCIDGGGARGLSSLVVLREIIHRINSPHRKDEKSLEPYEHFDMIAGTGTGGISACMLGRLRMPIDKVIEEFAKMMENVFSERKMSGLTMYKGTKLQEALKAMIRGATGNEGEMMIEGQAKDGCKTAVFAMAKHNLNASIPVMFRSYEATSNPGPNCTIWQALYATMAHPDLFKGIDIHDSSVPQSFIGGEIGCSNPLAQVLTEVKRVWPDHKVACISSIGAGRAKTIRISNPSWRQLLSGTREVDVMKGMATDSERVAEEMAARFRDTRGVYFRFNVSQGMQDMKDGSWERLGEAMAHTKGYLEEIETNRMLENAIHTSIKRGGAISTTLAAGQIPEVSEAESVPQATKLKRIPAPTPVYTGREDENARVIACITGNKSERRVCVVYGLGGVGKTQLVLNVVERTRDEWDHVIFVDASSNATIEGGLGDFAVVMKIGNKYEDTIEWLESCRERWLVIFDNADTPSTNIRQYIPAGRHGSVLITTRLPDLATLGKGPGSSCHLSSMSAKDGLDLFLRITCQENQCLSDVDKNNAEMLLQEFGCLALAIVHAGAYIAHSPGMTFTKYRTLFLSQRKRMLEQYNELPVSAKLDDYGKTVYTTWRMCYDQLKLESRTMLWLMSYLHYADIFEDIFERAAKSMDSHRTPLPLNELESQAQNHVQMTLSTFLAPDKRWDTVKFTNVMADLRLYSLIDYDRMNLAYSMHVLVQDWARTVIPQDPGLAMECSTKLISLSINMDGSTQTLAFNRRLGPHVMSLVEKTPKIGANHAYWFTSVFKSTMQWSQQEKLELGVLETFRQELGEDNAETLLSMGELAKIYSHQGRWNEAEQIGAQVLNTSKKVWGNEHPETMMYMGSLAATYTKLGRWSEAEQMQVQALSACKQLMGDEHPQTMNVMDGLATTYSSMKRYNEAEQLRVQVLGVRKRVLGEEHPKTLNAMAKLARTCANLRKWDEAISLFTTASTISQVHLGAEHPRTQEYLQGLAKVQKQGRA